MRQTTKRKTWGRELLISGLRIAIYQVAKAHDAKTDEERNLAIKTAAESLARTAQGIDMYKLERKRISAGLARIQKQLAAMLDIALAIPITQEEKAVARVTRGRKKEAKRGKNS